MPPKLQGQLACGRQARLHAGRRDCTLQSHYRIHIFRTRKSTAAR